MSMTEETYYVRLQSTKGIGQKRLHALIKQLHGQNMPISELYTLTPSQIARTFHLPPKVAQAICETPPPDAINQQIHEKRIQVFPISNPNYPKRLVALLGDDAPPLLYAWGNLSLLNAPTVGFCGSRQTSPKGLEIVRDTALQLVERRWVVVSGHAAGVDMTAHHTALAAGGQTIIVAPQGMLTFKLNAALRHFANAQNVLILSESYPTNGWSIGNAMARNKTIIGLSDAMILIESRREGGTFEAGKTALQYNVPLYVIDYQEPPVGSEGNQYFLKHGAVAIHRHRDTNRANLAKLLAQVESMHL